MQDVCKVYGLGRYDILHSIHPFMMIWPPTFPMVMDDHARYAFSPLDDPCSVLVEAIKFSYLQFPSHLVRFV